MEGSKVISARDVALVAAGASAIPPATGVYLDDDYGTCLAATVVDFQMHTTTVQRALTHYTKRRRAELRDATDFRRLFAQYSDERDGNTALAQYLWGYSFWTRARLLRDLVSYLESIGVTTFGELGQRAATSTFERDFAGRVKGLGPAVYRWLVMRLGRDTVKPDVHVRRFVRRCLGRDVCDGELVQLVTEAAVQIGWTPRNLDWAIWESERGGRGGE